MHYQILLNVSHKCCGREMCYDGYDALIEKETYDEKIFSYSKQNKCKALDGV